MSILFASDWNRFPRAIPDYKTKNESFIKMAVLLNKMGIKNCLFPLALLQPELQGVDPHDTANLTDAQKTAILFEVQYNPWYFFREIVKIPPKAGSKPIDFRINRATLATYWLFFNHVRSYLILCRQVGKDQPLNAQARTPTGWKKNGDLIPGDLVITPSGLPSKVLATYPQGLKDVYRITLDDGRSTQCGLEHMWDIWTDENQNWTTVDTGDIIKRLNAGESIYVPLASPEQTADSSFIVPPYVVGSNINLNANIVELNDEYLRGSHKQRLELLQGILDNNALVTPEGILLDVENDELRKTITYLIRSIGGVAYTDGTVIDIRHHTPALLFQHPYMKECAEGILSVNADKLRITSIVPEGQTQTLCIEIDHPDHLYVTDDFIVTHNTVGMSALVQGVMKFWANNTLFQQITKDTKLKLETIDTIKEIGSLLPSYLTSINVELDNPESKTEIKYSLKNNLFKSMVGRNDRKAANNLGRGATSPILWFDEPPFTPFIGETVPAALGSMSAAVEEAAKSGNPYGVVFTTTAGKIDDRDGGFIYGLVQAAAPWSEHMYDCRNRDDLISMIRMNMADSESAIAVNCTFTHNQLGYSDEWLRRKIAESSGSKEQADMDWRVIWASGGAYSPLTADQLEAIRQSEMEPTHTERTKDNYLIRWYDDPETHEENLQAGNYVLGIDSSEAVGRDAIAMVITDVRDLSVVGVATVNDTNLTRYAVWLCDLLTKYPKITGIIERKSSGVGILDHLLYVMQSKGIDPFKRLYNKLVDEQNLRVDEYKEVKGTALARRDAFFYDKFRRDFGFITDKKSRQELYRDVMAEAVRRGARKLRDKILAGELKKLEIRKNRVDHPDGGHDDHVIAWLMTAWFLLNSRHHQVYGIPANAVFASITDNGGDITEEDRKLGERIEQLHEDMNEAFAELRRTENPYAIVQLEQRIRNLNAKIGQSGGVANNVDTLIQQAMFERRRKYLDRAKTPNYLGRWNG